MHIGENEVKWLFAVLLLSPFTVDALAKLFSFSGNAAFLSMILIGSAALLWFVFTENLFSECSFSGAIEICYGKIGSKLVFMLYFAACIISAVIRLKGFVNALSYTVYGKSPSLYLTGFFAVAMLCACFSGIENLARYAKFAGVAAISAIALIFIMSFPNFKTTNVFPLFGKGGGEILKTVKYTYLFSDIVYIFLLSNSVRKKYSIFKCGAKAVIISMISTFVLSLAYALCVPYPASENYRYPLFRTASLINFSVFFQRTEGIVYVIWMFLAFVSCGALAAFGVIMFSKCFKCSDCRGVCPLVVWIIAALSALSTTTFENLHMIFSYVLFAFTLITGIILRMKCGRIQK